MMESVIAIKKFKKSEELARAFKLRCWNEKIEFSVAHEKLLRDFLQDNLQIISETCTENVGKNPIKLEELANHFDVELSKKMGKSLQAFNSFLSENKLEKHPSLPIYSQERTLYVLAPK
jgi:hypothetical protein